MPLDPQTCERAASCCHRQEPHLPSCLHSHNGCIPPSTCEPEKYFLMLFLARHLVPAVRKVAKTQLLQNSGICKGPDTGSYDFLSNNMVQEIPRHK